MSLSDVLEVGTANEESASSGSVLDASGNVPGVGAAKEENESGLPVIDAPGGALPFNLRELPIHRDVPL